MEAKYSTSTNQIALRDYQTEALDAIEAALSRGLRRQLVVLPTGTGKTIVFANLIQRRSGRALVIVHRDELAQQAVEKIRLIIPDTDIGIVKADQNNLSADVVIASVQTISRPNRLAQLPVDFNTVIIDEAHHAAADSYQAVLNHIWASGNERLLILGVTATPDRGDGAGLDSAFDELVYAKNLQEMISAGYLSDLRALQIHLSADFGQLHTRAGDFVDSETAQMLLDADAPTHAVKAYQENAAGRKTLLFTPTVELAHLMASVFVDRGIRAEALDGGTPIEERRDMLRRFKNGNTKVLANCAVLTEGFDEPSVDCVIVARPTRARSLYTQMVGRGTRTFPGKEDCLILDLVGATTRHDLMTTASLFGVEPRRLERGRSVIEAMEEEARERSADPRRQMEGRLIASAVDLFRKAKLHWVQSDTSYTLTIGIAGMILLKPDAVGDTWTAVLYGNDRTARTLAAHLPLSYAQGKAEDFARNVGAAALLSKTAPWRKKPASSKQREALRKFRIPSYKMAHLTAGEASDMLTSAIARRA